MDTAIDKQHKILNYLNQNLINFDLETIYDQLFEYSRSNGKSNVNGVLRTALQRSFQRINNEFEPEVLLALNFPIFLETIKPNAKTLMIIAKDSIPHIDDIYVNNYKKNNLKNEIGFITPFGIIDDWIRPTFLERENIGFFNLLNSEYNLYVTDIIKIGFKLPKRENWTNSNFIATDCNFDITEINKDLCEIVSKEIEIIKPDAIVTIGNEARNTLLKINETLFKKNQKVLYWKDSLQMYQWNSNIPIIASPHINSSGEDEKFKIINNPKNKDLFAVYNNEKLAKIILNEVSEIFF
jgi:hypothetical protein